MADAPDPSGFGGFPHGHGKGKGRAVNFDESGSSHNYWPFCATCHEFVQNPVPCIHENHYLPGMAMTGSNDLLPRSRDDQLHFSEHTDPGTGFSDSGPFLTTPSMLETSNTFDSLLASGQPTGDVYASNGNSIDMSNGFDWPNSEDPGPSQPNQNHNEDDFEMPDYVQPELTVRQREHLEFWGQEFVRENRRPSDRQVQLFAELVGLSVETIFAWFGGQPTQQPFGQTRDPAPQAHDVGLIPNVANTDHDIHVQVRDYAAARAERHCENAQSRKADTERHYKCTVGCRFSADDLDTWKRHLRNRYPQNFWHCVLCRDGTRKPFISHRRDKIFDHLRKVHPSIHESHHKSLRDESKVQHGGQFPSQCPFHNGSRRCNHTFQSWEEFLQHCQEHFDEQIHDDSWELPIRQRNLDDDDENGGSGPSTSSSNGCSNPSKSSIGLTSSSNPSNGRRTSSKTTAGPSKQREVHVEVGTKTFPFALIDVRHHRVIESPPQQAKWLALDYSWASSRCSQSKLLYDASSMVGSSGALHPAGLPMPFKRAIALTREMGYQYLWIDKICEPIEGTQRRDAIFRQAALIIVIVGFNASPDHIWHFTCDYKNLQTVLNWAQKSIANLSFSHIQNLGHGAYGIVDKVLLHSTDETYARKTCVSRAEGRFMQPRYVQEIEILQKFDHPNITKFVAAYVQRRSLNILMLPVAECDLREFLTTPDQWGSKLQFLWHWFRSLASAVEYMHGLSCRHKDIKPANVLISGHDVLLSDFGTSHDFSTSDSDSNGPGFMTPKYCAPEVAQKKRRGRKADIFSLGCVFLEMITVDLGRTLRNLSGHLGFKSRSRDTKAVYHKHVDGIRTWLKRLDDSKPSPYQRRIIDITARMVDEIPSQRPTAQEVCNALSLGLAYRAGRSSTTFSYGYGGAMVLHQRLKKVQAELRAKGRAKSGHRSPSLSTQVRRPLSKVGDTLGVSASAKGFSLGGLVASSLDSMGTKVDLLHMTVFEFLASEHGPCLGYHRQVVDTGTKMNPELKGLRSAYMSILKISVGYNTVTASGSSQDATKMFPGELVAMTVIVWLGGTAHKRPCSTKSESTNRMLLPETDRRLVHRQLDHGLLTSSQLQSPHAPLQPLASGGARHNHHIEKHGPQSLRTAYEKWARVFILLRVLRRDSQTDGKNDDREHGKRNSRIIVRPPQWLRSISERLFQASPTKTKHSRGVAAPISFDYDFRFRLKRVWAHLDRLFASYERRLLFVIQSKKSQVAVILKRRLQRLNICPPDDSGACPQHRQMSLTTPVKYINPAPCALQAAGETSNCDRAISGGLEMASSSYSTLTSDHSSAPNDTFGDWSDWSLCVPRRAPQLNDNFPRFDKTNGGYAHGIADPSHSDNALEDFNADVDSVMTNQQTLAPGSRHTPAFFYTGDDDDDEDNHEDHLVDVGDFGMVPITTIRTALARHQRCTCNHRHQHNDLYLPDLASHLSDLDVESDADSDIASVCSSSQMLTSLHSVSSATSLGSLSPADFGRPPPPGSGTLFSPLFNPLRLTADDVNLEIGILETGDMGDFADFDMW